MTYHETRIYLKNLAAEIRVLKSSRKQDKRGDRKLFSIEGDILEKKRAYRINHIAMSLFRGTPAEKIEKHPDDKSEDFWNKYIWKQARERLDTIQNDTRIDQEDV